VWQVLDLVHPSMYPLVYGKSRRVGPGAEEGVEASVARMNTGEVVSGVEVRHAWVRDSKVSREPPNVAVRSPRRPRAGVRSCRGGISGCRVRWTCLRTGRSRGGRTSTTSTPAST
jgi:hypothetical protein